MKKIQINDSEDDDQFTAYAVAAIFFSYLFNNEPMQNIDDVQGCCAIFWKIVR